MLRRGDDFIFEMIFPFKRLLDLEDIKSGTPTGALDMYEEDGTLYIRILAPGFKEEDISISLQDGVLKITAQRTKEESKKNRRYFRREIVSEAFTRMINLPYPVDEKKAEAYFEDGYLVIKLPKLKADKKGANIIKIRRKK